MNEQIAKILKFVEQGKLTADEAQELIVALTKTGSAPATGAVEAPSVPVDVPMTETVPPSAESGATPPPPPPTAGVHIGPQSPFAGIVDTIEKLGKDVTNSVNWNEVGEKIRTGAEKGIDALKTAAEQLKDGKLGFAFGEIEKRQIILPIQIHEGQILRIENFAGDVKVFCNSAEGRVTADAVFRADTRVEALQKSEAYSLAIEESDHMVTIRQPEANGIAIDLKIEIPISVPVEIKSSSGDLVVIGATGANRIEGRSGDILVQDSKGSLQIDASSGDIKIERSEFSILNIEGKSGDISLVDVGGSLSIRTASGDVSASRYLSGSVAVEAVTGDIRFDYLTPVTSTVNLRTVSGAIDLGISDGSDCRVSLSTVRGDVSTAVELTDSVREASRVTGSLGNGSGSIELSAVNGDLMLHLRNHEAVTTTTE